MPLFDAMYRLHNPDGFNVVGIAIDNPENTQLMLDSMDITYTNLLAEKTGNLIMSEVGNSQGLLPYSVLIGENGELLDQVLGKVDEQQINTWLKNVLVNPNRFHVMSWQQISLVVDKQYVQICSELFEGFLAQAVTTQNAGDDAFYEIAFPGIPDWQKVKVTALFDSSIDSAPIINFVVEQLTVLTRQEIPVSVSKLLDQDWERVWLDSFETYSSWPSIMGMPELV